MAFIPAILATVDTAANIAAGATSGAKRLKTLVNMPQIEGEIAASVMQSLNAAGYTVTDPLQVQLYTHDFMTTASNSYIDVATSTVFAQAAVQNIIQNLQADGKVIQMATPPAANNPMVPATSTTAGSVAGTTVQQVGSNWVIGGITFTPQMLLMIGGGVLVLLLLMKGNK